MKYKMKPLEIEAIQYIGTGESFEEVDDFTNGLLIHNYDDDEPQIKTPEGYMYVSVGDYIIKDKYGEFHQCSKRVFERTYEKVK